MPAQHQLMGADFAACVADAPRWLCWFWTMPEGFATFLGASVGGAFVAAAAAISVWGVLRQTRAAAFPAQRAAANAARYELGRNGVLLAGLASGYRQAAERGVATDAHGLAQIVAFTGPEDGALTQDLSTFTQLPDELVSMLFFYKRVVEKLVQAAATSPPPGDLDRRQACDALDLALQMNKTLSEALRRCARGRSIRASVDSYAAAQDAFREKTVGLAAWILAHAATPNLPAPKLQADQPARSERANSSS